MTKLRKAKASGKPTTLTGPVRFARQPSDVAALRPGDIALVSLPDLDASQTHGLIEAGVVAVLNSAPSSTGRVPNQGPALLADAGIALVDVNSDSVWSRLSSGDVIEVRGGEIFLDSVLVTSGSRFDPQRPVPEPAATTDNRAVRLDALTTNASDHIRREKDMLLDGQRIPRLRTKIAKRPVVVVAAGDDAAADLKGLKRYIAQSDPVLIGAGAGADVLLKAGYQPAILVGDADNFTDEAIARAGEVVVTTATGKVTRPDRLEKHGRDITTFTATGSDDDLAIVLADTNGASVIVHAGGPRGLTDLLERAPSEAARLIVAKLRVGSKIVDAKAVGELSGRPVPWWPILLLLIAGLVALVVAIWVTPVGQEWTDQLRGNLPGATYLLGGFGR